MNTRKVMNHMGLRAKGQNREIMVPTFNPKPCMKFLTKCHHRMGQVV
jgi:hypothetical protein